jgi:hypothetical protein
MQLETLTWDRTTGWSHPFPAVNRPTLVLAFGGAVLDQTAAPLAELVAAYDDGADGVVIMGCSSAGEIAGATVADDGLSVAIVSFESTRIELVTAEVRAPADSYPTGRRIAAALEALDHHGDLRAVFVLSDGLVVNGGALVAGMTSVAPPGVVITGGLAGDGDRFGATWVIVGGEPRSDHVTAVGLYGRDLEVGHGSRGGWDNFGPERLVTRSAGNVLYELDGQPALELYKKYLGDRAAGLPATALLFPLAVRMPGRIARTVTRTILGVDEAAQSMTFAGDVPQGARVQLMRANFDRLVESAQDAAQDAFPTGEPTAEEPVLAVAISCVGRRLLLGERIEDELEATAAGLPAHAELVGFYSYGEISPVAAGTCDLHNQTMTVTTYRERLPGRDAA